MDAGTPSPREPAMGAAGTPETVGLPRSGPGPLGSGNREGASQRAGGPGERRGGAGYGEGGWDSDPWTEWARSEAVHRAPEEPLLAWEDRGTEAPRAEPPPGRAAPQPVGGPRPRRPPSVLVAVPGSPGREGPRTPAFPTPASRPLPPTAADPPGPGEKGEMAPGTLVRRVHAAPPHPQTRAAPSPFFLSPAFLYLARPQLHPVLQTPHLQPSLLLPLNPGELAFLPRPCFP